MTNVKFTLFGPSMLVNKKWHGKFFIFLKGKEHVPLQLLHTDIHFDSAKHSWCWPDSVVSTATHYRQYSYEFETWGRRHFLHRSRLALGSTQPPVKWVPVPFPTAFQWLPTPSSTKVNERVMLYLYSPPVPSWQAKGRCIPLPLPLEN